ncbi:MAG TPA: WD40 repeat domain-containing protein, partial [Verrucomicrobiae bacterium]
AATLTDIAHWQDVAQCAFPTNASFDSVSAAGDWVVGSDTTGNLYTVETATSRCVVHPSSWQAGQRGQVKFAPSGLRFLSTAGDLLSLWEAEAPKPVATLQTPRWFMQCLNLSPGGRYAVAGGPGEFVLWDLKKSSHAILKTSLRGNVYGATFLPPDDATLVIADMTRGLEFWDLGKSPPVMSRTAEPMWAWDLASSPDGERLFTPHTGGLAVFSVRSGRVLADFRGLPGPRQPGFALHPDGNTIVWRTADQLVTWRAPAFAEIETVEKAEADRQQAHKAAADLMVARAREAGVIKQWLVLAPLPFGLESQSGVAALDREQLPQEAQLQPRAGNRVKLATGKRTWRAVQLKDPVIDFTRFSGSLTNFNLAYAVCYFRSDADRTNLVLKVGSDDQAKIYLNGKEIYRQIAVRACVQDQDVVKPVALRAGLNVLVFKVVNEECPWEGTVRLTDTAGQPVEGIKVDLKPDDPRGH